MDVAANPVKFGTKLALVAGFGGVLLLMTIAGVDSIRVLHGIENDHSKITETYVARHHSMQRLWSSIWLSTSLLRDYLLQPDRSITEPDRARLEKFRREADSALERYYDVADSREQSLLTKLRSELESHWKAVQPALGWSARERSEKGYSFLRTEVFPRRAAMLEIAEKMDSINEQALRADDQRAADLFARFRRRTIGSLVTTLTIGLGLAVLSIAHILRLEKDARLRYREILRARRELEKLSARLVQAQEEERRAISRELHDEVGQSLSALLVDLGNVAAVTPCADNPDACRMLATARGLAEGTLDSVRNLALLLRPSMLDDFGLVPALNWQAREVSRRTGMRVSVSAEGVADEFPDQHNTCIYRVVQEALHNCARHSEAKSVRIAVAEEAEGLRLTIKDDGKGFDSQGTLGLGLLGMGERVKHLGGVFQIESQPGQGTAIKVQLPLTACEARGAPVDP